MNLPYTLTYLNTFEFLFALLFIDVIARLVVVKRGFTCYPSGYKVLQLTQLLLKSKQFAKL